MTINERDPQDDPFYGLGYTTPEQADELRDRRFASQRAPIDRQTHPDGHVHDRESDRDHDIEILTMDEVRETRKLPRSDTGREAARAALREIQDVQFDAIAAGDETYAAALRQARDARFQRNTKSA